MVSDYHGGSYSAMFPEMDVGAVGGRWRIRTAERGRGEGKQ
jgi:hypothetical protein